MKEQTKRAIILVFFMIIALPFTMIYLLYRFIIGLCHGKKVSVIYDELYNEYGENGSTVLSWVEKGTETDEEA